MCMRCGADLSSDDNMLTDKNYSYPEYVKTTFCSLGFCAPGLFIFMNRRCCRVPPPRSSRLVRRRALTTAFMSDIRQYSSDTTHLTENSSPTTHLITHKQQQDSHPAVISRSQFLSKISLKAIYTVHTARRQTRMAARHQRTIAKSPHGTTTPNALYTHQKRQTRTPGRHQHAIFASPHGTATPNAIYTQQGAKPAWQQDINTQFSQLRTAQLPQTQFTHTKSTKPARQEHINTQCSHLRMATATPNAIYTHQSAKPECQADINTQFSHLRMAQLLRTQCTHSKAPNPQAWKTSTHNLRMAQLPRTQFTHSIRRQTPRPGRHQHTIFASPHGTTTPNAIYTQYGAKPARQEDINAQFSQLCMTQLPQTIHTQQAAKPARQEDINAKLSHLLVAQLPGALFTHSKPPKPACQEGINTKVSHLRMAQLPRTQFTHSKRQTCTPRRHQHTTFASPHGTATPNAIYTQQGAKPAWQQDINTEFSQLRTAQLPQTQFTHTKAPNPHARNTSTHNFRTSAWHSYPERNLHTASAKPARQEDINAQISHLRMAQLPRTQFITQQGAKPACPKDINTQFSHLRVANPNAIYTQYGAKSARQEDINAQFSQLCVTQLPQITIYTQQGAKPERQEDINTPFSQLHMTQLPRTQFTHSKASHPHARKTSSHNFRISARHSFNSERNWQGAKPSRQEDINAQFSHSSRLPAATRCSPFWRLWLLRLPGAGQQRPAADVMSCVSCVIMYVYEGDVMSWVMVRSTHVMCVCITYLPHEAAEEVSNIRNL